METGHWFEVLLRITLALQQAPDEVTLYLNRVHFEQLKSFLMDRPSLRDALGATGRTHCQLREVPYPIVGSLLPQVDGART